ncbi:MAG: ATP-binding cassette domain-containing protein, partial [bacterium]
FFDKKKYFKTEDVQFVWEFQNMYEELSLTKNLEIYFKLNCKKNISFKEELQNILKYWDLELYLTKPVKSLSYGYRQKALITRSIIVKPDVLIVDEPFLGLDYMSYKSFIKIIKDYRDITFLISTQNPNVIRDFLEEINNNINESLNFNINQDLTIFSFIC